jgi:hypothetical protein
MPTAGELPRAFGCGWSEGKRACESRCTIASCRRTNPCESEWADDIYRIIKYRGGVPPYQIS